jgi:DNA-binding transcriptional regulator YiaG
MAQKQKSLDDVLKRAYEDVKDYVAGKTAARTTIMTTTGDRIVFYETLPESKVRVARHKKFKAMRAKLALTQPQMAAALRVSVNTLKGWEAGKPIPDVAFTLAEVLHDFPAVRKKLLAV